MCNLRNTCSGLNYCKKIKNRFYNNNYINPLFEFIVTKNIDELNKLPRQKCVFLLKKITKSMLLTQNNFKVKLRIIRNRHRQ